MLPLSLRRNPFVSVMQTSADGKRNEPTWPLVCVQAPAHAGEELERHEFEYTNGREDWKQIYPPSQEFPNLLEIDPEMPRQ